MGQLQLIHPALSPPMLKFGVISVILMKNVASKICEFYIFDLFQLDFLKSTYISRDIAKIDFFYSIYRSLIIR